MFDESFTKLDVNETAQILDTVNKRVEGSLFDPLETTILSIEVPFYPGYRFLNIADHATNPPLERFVFQRVGTQDFTLLDWNYKTIYKLNAECPIQLSDDNVIEYVRFYFSFVKGRHGRFVICESADHIRWKDDPPADVRKKLNQTLHPLKIKEKKSNGTYVIEAFMMLKDALFKADVYVTAQGEVRLQDHEIIIENVPVLDTALAQ